MKYLITTLIISLSLLAGLKPEEEKKFTVTVNNIKDGSGIVGVAVFNDASEFPEGEIFMGEEKSLKSGGSVEITIEGIPEGDYAIAVMHDSNENGDIDINDQGMPEEGFGFSNDAMGEMGPPDFDQAAFAIDEDTDIEVTLIYLLGKESNQ